VGRGAAPYADRRGVLHQLRFDLDASTHLLEACTIVSVLITLYLQMRGEVAEWPKAAVC
jgi:hypothetical protein